jgi:predicted Zn finger-like uncharacterized protein
MPITINCKHCLRQLQVQEAHLGKQVRCPACQQIFTAVAPPPAEPEEVVSDISAFEVPEPPAVPVTPARPSQRRQPQDSLDFESETRRRPEEDDEEQAGDVKPHRGGVILTMGILTLVFAFCCPPICWIIGGIGENMAGKDLRMMSLRQMDRSGRSMTQTGKTLMGVGIALSILVTIGYTILRFITFRR